jgi:S-(hydroxymethyl)glutathione dehydrogenase / alcohol dehydrogenase
MKTRAAVLCAPKEPFRIEEVDLEEPRAGEVLVKLSAVGVCHSDWHLVTGATKHPMPVIAGHEGAGVVQAVGQPSGEHVPKIKVGDHVVLSWAPACGTCFYCLRDRPNLCDTYTAPIWNGTMLDGTTRHALNGKALYSYCGLAAFATHTVVPAQSCVVIRKDVSLEAACLVGCAVATGVGAALFTAKVRPGDTCVVFGCGGVGLNIIQGCRLAGATQIFAVDTEPKKIWIAKHFGATSVFMPTDNLPDIVRQRTNGRGADHAFEAIGLSSVQEQALRTLRPGGTLTLAGLSAMGTTTNFPAAEIARKEWTIRGSYYGTTNPPRDFPLLLDLYKADKLNLDDLITRRYRLEQINQAYDDMLKGELARGVIVL